MDSIHGVLDCTECYNILPDSKRTTCLTCPRTICNDCLDKEAELVDCTFYKDLHQKLWMQCHYCTSDGPPPLNASKTLETIPYNRWKVLHHGGVKDDGGDEGSGGDVLAISEPFMSIREQNISDFVSATGGRCSLRQCMLLVYPLEIVTG